MSEESYKHDAETLAKVNALLEDKLEEKRADKQDSSDFEMPEQERQETERNTTFDSSNFTQNALYAWSMQTPELQEVVVSETEKSMYLKAVLHDKAIRFPIMLEMGDDEVGNITIELRTLNNYETDVVFQALEVDRKEGLITGHHQLTTRLQQYAGALQIDKIQTDTFNHLEFPEPGIMTEDVKTLRDFVTKRVGTMHFARWQAVLSALRVFETKIKICNDAALNGDFWTPLDADS